MKYVLFLCSGNYYRSRYAEYSFNWLAAGSGLRWRADSRGLRVGKAGNVGPISRYALEGLQRQGIPVPEERYPLQVSLADLAGADRVIAVKEAEHRILLQELFPPWAEQVEYWHIDDLDRAEPSDALLVLDRHVRALVEELHGADAA